MASNRSARERICHWVTWPLRLGATSARAPRRNAIASSARDSVCFLCERVFRGSSSNDSEFTIYFVDERMSVNAWNTVCIPVLSWKNVKAGNLQHFAGSKNRPAVSHCHYRSFLFSYSHFWKRRPRPRAAFVIENTVSNGHNLKIVRKRRCGEVRIR